MAKGVKVSTMAAWSWSHKLAVQLTDMTKVTRTVERSQATSFAAVGFAVNAGKISICMGLHDRPITFSFLRRKENQG